MFEETRRIRRQRRSRQNGITLVLLTLAVVAIIATITIAVIRNREMVGVPPVQPTATSSTFGELANQDDFDFQLYPGETVESAKYRAGTVGTGIVYVYNDGSVSMEPYDTVYVLNWPEIRDNYPEVSVPEVMYNWPMGQPGEGGERMVCVRQDELSGDTYTGYYCEVESLVGSD